MSLSNVPNTSSTLCYMLHAASLVRMVQVQREFENEAEQYAKASREGVLPGKTYLPCCNWAHPAQSCIQHSSKHVIVQTLQANLEPKQPARGLPTPGQRVALTRREPHWRH
jgi:hypothetical protein